MRKYNKAMIFFMAFFMIICISASGTVSAAESPSADFTSNTTHNSTFLSEQSNGTSTDLKNTGLSNYTGPEVNTTLWNYTTGGSLESEGGPVVGSDGTIYIGSGDGKLYALNPDGSVKWTYTTGGTVYGSTIGSDGTIYIGSFDDFVYALNPDGTLKWKYKTRGNIIGSPKIGSDGTIYGGSADSNLYALNSDGTLKWNYTTGGIIYGEGGGPAIGSDGTIYVGSGDGYLYAFNSDGTVKWKYDTQAQCIQGSAVVGSDGTIYIGIYDGKLFAINPDGTPKWNYTTGANFASPAIGVDGTIYIGSYNGIFYAINPDGTPKWNYTVGGPIYTEATIGADGTIYIGSYDGNLYAFSPNGKLLWTYTTGGKIYNSATIGANETLYFGSDDNNVYAISNTVCRANQTLGSAPLTVQFTGSGISPVSWYWDFGDRNHSTDQNPTHTYTNPGYYNVTMTVTNSDGQKRTVSFKQYIKVYNLPVSNFTGSTNWGTVPGVTAAVYNDIQFKDTSSNVPMSWYWDFGDGTNSTEENPTHAYTKTGTYTVSLAVTNPAGNGTSSIVVQVSGTISANSTLANGTYSTTQTLNLTSDDTTATIYYTNDTTDPRISSTRIRYTGPISINKTTTLRYAAITSIGEWSPLYVQNYVIGTGGLADSPSSTFGDNGNHTGQSVYTGPQTNNTDWNNSAVTLVQGTNVVIGSDGTIYAGSSNGYLYALYPTGMIKWVYYAENSVAVGTPTIGKDGTIYILANGYLRAINLDGTLKWKFNVYTTYRNVITSPAIGSDGTIYVLLQDDTSYYDTALCAINPADGTLKWNTTIASAGSIINGNLVIGSDGTIYVPGNNLYAVNPDGTIKWTYALGDQYSSPSIGSDGTIYISVSTGNTWNSTSFLYAINPDGTLKWTYNTKSLAYGTATIGPDGTVYISAGGYLFALNPADGTQKWNCTIGSSLASPVIGADGTIYLAGNGLLAINSTNGTIKWSYTSTSPNGNPVIDSDGTLYVGTSNGLYAFRDVAAKFVYTIGSNPLYVQFNDTSNNATSWSWDLGDGTTSALQSPTHTYAKSGQYLVTLKALTPDGVLTAAQMVTISDIMPPTATVSPNGENFNTTENVTLNATDDSGSLTLYYTTDGSDPRTSSTRHVYTSPITLSNTTTIEYAAVDSSGNWSPMYDETYTKSEVVSGVVVYVQDDSYYTGSLNDQIQSILNNAAPGTTIKFLGQDYEGLHLVINKQLNIISDVGTKILTSDLSAVFLIDGAQASGTTISGFTINNTGSGISVNNADNVTLSNNELISTKGTTVLVNESFNTTIKGSSIHDSFTGISISGSNSTQINASNIYNNNNGIVIGSSENTRINQNQIMRNAGNGVSVSNSNSTTISGNTFTQNGKTANGSAIYLENTTNININQNQINNNFYGITCNNITNATIANSTFLNNDRDGILLNTLVTNATIVSNIMQQNDNGINLNCASDYLTIGENIITGNTKKASGPRPQHGNGVYLGTSYVYSTTFRIEHNILLNNAYMDFQSCNCGGVYRAYYSGSNLMRTYCKKVDYDAQMILVIKKANVNNAFTASFYDGVTGEAVTGLPSFDGMFMNGAYSQTATATDGRVTTAFEKLSEGDVIFNCFGLTAHTAYNSAPSSDGSTTDDSGNHNEDSHKGDPGTVGDDSGNGGSGGSGSASSSGSSASTFSSTTGVTAIAAAAAAGASSQGGSDGNDASKSKTAQELFVNDLKKDSQIWGIVGVVILIILVLGLYYRKDLMNMIRKSKK